MKLKAKTKEKNTGFYNCTYGYNNVADDDNVGYYS